MSTLLLDSLALAIGYVVLVWILSLILGRVCIIDAFWGPGFVLLATLNQLLTSEAGLNRPETLLLAMVALWGTRLGIHLSIRIFGDPHEDRRYAAMRDKYQPGWWLKSLAIVFLLQGLIMWFVALPVIAAYASPGEVAISFLGPLGIFLWGVGVFFEAVGDWQLARFRANPDNKGRVLNSGLWGLTRHPNYFGDFCVWWGLYLIAAAGGAGWTCLSPLLMSVLLMKVSGVTLLESTITHRRPAYEAYRARTNAFFPGPPRPPQR